MVKAGAESKEMLGSREEVARSRCMIAYKEKLKGVYIRVRKR